MAPYIKSRVLLQLAAILVAAIVPKGGESSLLKVKVQIFNKLYRETDLIVHCKDKNHDLGKQTIKEDEMFEFSVKINLFIPNVLYYCSFNWDAPPEEYTRYFDIYKQTRDYRCNTCTWQIYEDGPCKGDDDCYGWNDNPPTLAPLGVVLSNETNISIPEFH